MRITGVETIRLGYQMPYALTYARGEYQTREALLVKVHTDDRGIIGWGEAAMWGGPHAVSATVIEQEIAPLVIGRGPAAAGVSLGEGLSVDLLPRPQGHR